MGYILITGTSGFIGSNLLKYIEENFSDDISRLVLLTNSTSSKYITISHRDYKFSTAEFIEKGITDIESVIHLGAFIPKETSELHLLDENYSNVTNTYFLLKNLPSSPRNFIFISTVDVYKTGSELIDELSPISPADFYSECKLFCEKIVLRFCEMHSVIPQILRLGHIYGKGEEAFRKLIPETIRNIRQNKAPVIYSEGKEIRRYLHTSDCVNAIWKALKLNEYAGPINVVSSHAFTVKEIIETLVKISGKNLPVQTLNTSPRGRDLLFDNSKMIKYLCDEKKGFIEGLTEEYNLFKNK